MHTPKNTGHFARSSAMRHRSERRFRTLALLATLAGVLALVTLITGILNDGVAWISSGFFENYPSRSPRRAGFHAAIYGSLWCISFTALIAIPIGICAALYLEEYSKRGRLHRALEILIANLAGVPSILYGMLGLIAFVRMFDQFDEGASFLGMPLPLGRSVLAGASTLVLLILPVIIIATREAIRAVPDTLRQAAFSLGATRWQCVRHHVLPSATPGIMTGIVLALSRALGETAPLIMIGALTYVAFVPESPFDPFTVMPIQIFNWASRPQEDFHHLAAAGIIVLLMFLFTLNGIAVLIRNRADRRLGKH